MPSDAKPIPLTPAERAIATRRDEIARAEAGWRERLTAGRVVELVAAVSVSADCRGQPLTKRQARRVAERAGEWAEGVVKGMKRGSAF